jgi:hypothetical protein
MLQASKGFENKIKLVNLSLMKTVQLSYWDDELSKENVICCIPDPGEKVFIYMGNRLSYTVLNSSLLGGAYRAIRIHLLTIISGRAKFIANSNSRF